jgi:hypothetical protein
MTNEDFSLAEPIPLPITAAPSLPLNLPVTSDGIMESTEWQRRAWQFYGDPGFGGESAVGEVRYVIGWVSQQCARVDWTVEIDGSTIDPDSPRAADTISLVSSQATTAQIATNLIVAGQLDYAAFPDTHEHVAALQELGGALAGSGDTRWIVVSVVDPNRRALLTEAALRVPGIWPHPPIRPDPPLRGVLDVLEEVIQLQDLAHAQNNSRIAQMSLLLIAKEMSLALSIDGSGGSFAQDIRNAINAPILNPRKTGAAPIVLTGPADIIERKGAAAAVQIGQPYDPRLDQRMEATVQRLAWGLPIPPEILLGMTSTNRATAFQIEESTYRGHIEPVCELIATVYSHAASLVLDSDVVFVPDPTDLLARRHSVADVKDAWDRGLVTASWVRKTLGIPEDAAATDEDLDILAASKAKGVADSAREADPSDRVTREGIQAAATTDSPPYTDTLAALDSSLRNTLSGACSLSALRSREKIGSRARSALPPASLSLIDGIRNDQVPSVIGLQQCSDLMDLPSVVSVATEPLIDWWERQVKATQSTIESLLGDIPADWPRALRASSAFLSSAMMAWVISELDLESPSTPPEDIIRGTMALAGGAPPPQ